MKSNTRFNSNTKGIECLNCKQPLDSRDHFCSNCGQVNDLKPLSIKQYLKEFFAGFFAFDTRTLNTIVPLLFKPGKVAKDYVEGHRMKYVNPFQFYFHTSIVFFLVMGIYMGIDDYNALLKRRITKNDAVVNKDRQENKNVKIKLFDFSDDENKETETIKTIDSIPYIIASQVDSFLVSNKTHKILLQKETNKEVLKKHFFRSVYDAQKVIVDDFLINSNDTIVDELHLRSMFYDSLQSNISKNHLNIQLDSTWRNNSISDYNTVVEHSFQEKINDFVQARPKNALAALDSMGYELSRWNILVFNKTKEIRNINQDKSSMNQFLQKIVSKLSIVLFFILPFFTLFVYLLYYRKHKTYTEHLIFVFNTQAVFLVLLLVFITFDRILDTSIGSFLAFILFLIYLYKALRYFYDQKRKKTIIKLLALVFVYYILASFGFVVASTLAFLD